MEDLICDNGWRAGHTVYTVGYTENKQNVMDV